MALDSYPSSKMKRMPVSDELTAYQYLRRLQMRVEGLFNQEVDWEQMETLILDVINTRVEREVSNQLDELSSNELELVLKHAAELVDATQEQCETIELDVH